MKDDKNYIDYLEKEINVLRNSQAFNINAVDLQNLLKYQSLSLKEYFNKIDYYIEDNQRLAEENSALTKTVLADQAYIEFLLNSKWWKMTLPFRILKNKINEKKKNDGYILPIITPDTDLPCLDVSVKVIIFTKNVGNSLKMQLDNINKQRSIGNISIVIFDYGSVDNTKDIAKKNNIQFVNINELKAGDIEKLLFVIYNSYDFIIELQQNKIIDSAYWIYQIILPLYQNETSLSVVLNNRILEVKNIIEHCDLDKYVGIFAGESILFLPKSRDFVRFLAPSIMQYITVTAKKGLKLER